MVNSGGDYPNRILMQRAEGYEVNADGKVENADFDNMLIKRGAGNMYSTVFNHSNGPPTIASWPFALL